MAMATLLLLLCFFLLINHPAAAELQDQPTMATLQKELVLADWGEPGSYCSWRGVACAAGPNHSVVALDLSRRGLRGNVSLVSGLRSLKRLDLSGNAFRGPIPPSVGSLAALVSLDLSMNQFDGSIPPSMGRLSALISLNLSNNLLSGGIPDELRNLERLQELQLSGNNLSGEIPNWVGDLIDLRVFSAYENSLVGVIPQNLGLFSQLQVLNLHSNHLGGGIPESIFTSGQLQVLILTVNRLNGSIPRSIGKCRGLSNLRIGNNRLAGAIPTSIGNVSSLTYFEADDNRLSGEIVPEVARCLNLTLLNLASNGFTGTVPDKLGELRSLQELIVSGNNLAGDFPRSILRCRNLSKLDLSYNRFNGILPENLCNMSRLQFLLLDHNSFTGEIPRGIGNCVRLLELRMGSNYLSGSIPAEIGRIKNLQVGLNLSFNRLDGPVPRELGKLDKLVSLDVSNNDIAGEIPPELKGMLSLIEVNFSNNQLSGPIPDFGPFQKSPQSSFFGNKDLCGDPLNSSCGDYTGSGYGSDQHKVSYKVILAVVGSGLTVFASVSVVVGLFMLREKQEKDDKASLATENATEPPRIGATDVFVESLNQAVDFDSCIKATFKDANKLSCGTFSTVYKAVMPSGLVLSVKKLKTVDRTVVHHQSKMIRELERLANLAHGNIARPIGYIIYEDVALLLHHHVPNGTLLQLVHDAPTCPTYEPDWPRRLQIAVGIAEGLAFLHQIAIIHLDISSGNIMLDSHYNAVIGEIEISKLLDPSKGTTASISAVAGSFGYIPPEYAYTMQVTVPGNVYSFGVILLEILTSRLPVDEGFGEGIDLVKWVHSASARGESPEQIMDPRLSTVSFAWRKQMLAVLKVALLCTDTTPAKRPKMKKVVEMLHEARDGK